MQSMNDLEKCYASIPQEALIRIETPRLVIRTVKPKDFPHIFRIKSQIETNQFQLYPCPRSLEEVVASYGNYIESANPISGFASESLGHSDHGVRSKYVFAVTEKDKDDYIGNVGTSSVMGGRFFSGDSAICPSRFRQSLDKLAYSASTITCFYEIDKDYRGRGYMTEALSAVIEYLQHAIGFGRVVIDPMPINHASIALAKRLGFTQYATTPIATWNIRQLSSEVQNQLRNSEYGSVHLLFEKKLPMPDISNLTNINQSQKTAIRSKYHCNFCQNGYRHANMECARCHAVRYCCKDCQVRHWKAVHKYGCKQLAMVSK